MGSIPASMRREAMPESETPGAVQRRAFQVKRTTTTNSYAIITSGSDYIPELAAAVGLPGFGPPMRNV